jgi:UDP-N-acetylmuramate dehydrogenase
MRLLHNVPLAPMTSLRIGGAARRFVEIDDEEALVAEVLAADARREPVFVLGGGSNVVVSDSGFDGLVVRVMTRGVNPRRNAGRAVVDVAAGEPWDDFVARAVSEGWSGVECLSGIPGLAGGAPMQNIGAYGQEVRATIESVRVLDRATKTVGEKLARDCRFAYRTSVFKGTERFVVLGVRFALEIRQDGAPVRYAELARALAVKEGARAPLAETRRTILGLRRAKGMVLDSADAESVSAGSFFVNPLLSDAEVIALEERVRAQGIEPTSCPRFVEEEGITKVPAAWLIERAGFPKGWGHGRAGISRKHALALVNRGGATAKELLEVAGAIQRGVERAFGVSLVAEPVLVGAM